MRKIKEVLRLKSAGMSNRKIAASCGISRPTVGKYLDRIEQAGLTWPLPNDLTEAALENQPYPNAQVIILKSVRYWTGFNCNGYVDKIPNTC